MTPAAWWALLAVLSLAGLYGLHRLCLWLEAKGQLYYLHRKPEGGGGAARLAELQEILEPKVRQVVRAAESGKSRPAGQSPAGPPDPNESRPADDASP